MKLKIAMASRDLGNLITGVQKYNYGFSQALVQYKQKYDIHFYYSQKEDFKYFPEVHQHYLPTRNRLLWDHIFLPLALLRDKIDYTIFPKGTKSILSPTRDLVIFNDLGYFYPQLNAYQALDTYYMKLMMPFSARHAWGVFTISDSTRQDVGKFLIQNEESKIKTIDSGITNNYKRINDERLLDEIQKKYNLQLPFIFYPTSISPRKNIGRLLDAWDKINSQIPHHLYMTGNKSWNASEINLRLENQDNSRVHLLGKVPEEDMAAIYNLADFVVYVSLMEGFGLPILEAMTCGVAVMAANISSIPEVCGDAALMVDPISVDSIAQGLLRMAYDNDLKNQLIAKGLIQAKKFSWSRTVAIALDWIETHHE
ncbi:MAG: hypothetical protein BGO78_09920 [Chloroflexi bacterium 44-23]|nr:MAG: hypothetical protein BGO78_09920 [Chloroflexi bacterium 44-23]